MIFRFELVLLRNESGNGKKHAGDESSKDGAHVCFGDLSEHVGAPRRACLFPRTDLVHSVFLLSQA